MFPQDIRKKIIDYNNSLDVIPFGILPIPKSEDVLITVEPICLADELTPEGDELPDGRVLFELYKYNNYRLTSAHKKKLDKLVVKLKEMRF